MPTFTLKGQLRGMQCHQNSPAPMNAAPLPQTPRKEVPPLQADKEKVLSPIESKHTHVRS